MRNHGKTMLVASAICLVALSLVGCGDGDANIRDALQEDSNMATLPNSDVSNEENAVVFNVDIALELIQIDPNDPRPWAFLNRLGDESIEALGLISRPEALRTVDANAELSVALATALAPYVDETTGDVSMVWLVPIDSLQYLVDPLSRQIVAVRDLADRPDFDPITIASQSRLDSVVREIRYALRGSDGICGKTHRGYCAGDWNYIDSNPGVRDQAVARGWPKDTKKGIDSQGYGIGDWCTFFAVVAVRRGTGDFWLPTNNTRYNNGISSKYTRPGHVLQSLAPHTAIVYTILAYDQYGNVTMVDTIDSNYIRDMTIGQHPLSSSLSGGGYLYSYRTWANY